MRRTAGWLLVGLAPVALVSLAVASACTATVNTDGLESTGETAPDASVVVDATLAADATADANADAAASADTNANADANEDDGAPSFDASDDATALADAGAPDAFACANDASAYTLCADFDEDTLAFDYSNKAYQWQPFTLGDAGLALSTSDVVSPPASLAIAVASSTVATGATFRLDLPTTTTAVHLEFDVKPDFSGLDAGVIALANLFEITASRIYYGVNLTVGTAGYAVMTSALLPDGGNASSSHLLPRLAAGQWTHVTVIDTRADPGHLSIALDGKSVLEEDVNTLTAGKPELRLDLGLESSGATSAASLHLDNVTLVTAP